MVYWHRKHSPLAGGVRVDKGEVKHKVAEDRSLLAGKNTFAFLRFGNCFDGSPDSRRAVIIVC